MNRRQFTLTPLALTSACGQPAARDSDGWPVRWDRILTTKAVEAADLRFDGEHSMIQAILGPEYRYHTKMRECRVHPTRDSLEYALNLLEEGSAARMERARQILRRVLPLQVTDPESKWYGIWGWYMEEPPDKMSPADWNWADFNGSLLLLAEIRHGARLGDPLRAQVREAIRHAAYSVKRRNVSMSYTNIAVKGTFVTLAAAELLNDAELAAYAQDRAVRLCRQIDQTGSFAEYNSPTYAQVTITNLTRIRMFVKNEEARGRAAQLEHRAWQHLAAHWDVARAQFAGPMSRCYGNDTAYPLWLEKGLRGRLGLANPENRSGGGGEAAIHDYRCPEDLVQRFLRGTPGSEHRELFIAQPETAGTTFFSRDFSLGSANRADFWVQRRPLLAYFGDTARPARTVQMRVVKDGYDFSSALFHSVQQKGRVLGLISFRNPGGDKHISLDPIRDGQFECGRLFGELDFEGLPAGFTHELKDGVASIKSSSLNARFQLIGARFGAHAPRLQATASSQSLTITFDFKPPEAPRLVRWADLPTAYAAFALELSDASAAIGASAPTEQMKPGAITLQWGELQLSGLARVDAADRHEAAYAATISGTPVPAPRLNDKKLA